MLALSHPWVLIRFGGAPPGAWRPGTSVAFLTRETDECYFGDLLALTLNKTLGTYEWRRHNRGRRIPKDDVVHVFPCRPSYGTIRDARRALTSQAAEAKQRERTLAHQGGGADA